jgi:hypothetical protein
MPTLSMFFGLIVYMYAKDNQRHHTLHIHVQYQDDEAVFSIYKSVDNYKSRRPYGKLELSSKRKYLIQN